MCYETNFEDAQKVNKYKDLAEAGRSKNRHCFLQDVSRKEGHTQVPLHLDIEKLFNIAALHIYSSVIIHLAISYIFLLPLGPVYNSVPCNSSTCFDRSGNVGLVLFCTLVSL